MPTIAYAQTPKDAACEGLALTGGKCDNPAADGGNGSESQINKIVKTVIDIFSMIVGVVAVIMIIIGGFKYITSMGDSTSTASAKNTILYAVIGLVIVAMSQVIVRFVLGRL
jgi:uncharacterized membrane protein